MRRRVQVRAEVLVDRDSGRRIAVLVERRGRCPLKSRRSFPARIGGGERVSQIDDVRGLRE
jgi:hypothetical protein